MRKAKAIDTVYNGYKFRSRLEARWAVFFDALDIKYDYEPEGFELSDGIRYLPDFWLPEFDLWVEIKPEGEPKDIEKQKAVLLADGTGFPVYIVAGQPKAEKYGISVFCGYNVESLMCDNYVFGEIVKMCWGDEGLGNFLKKKQSDGWLKGVEIPTGTKANNVKKLVLLDKLYGEEKGKYCENWYNKRYRFGIEWQHGWVFANAKLGMCESCRAYEWEPSIQNSVKNALEKASQARFEFGATI